jgi:hypothetical protein
MGTVLALLELEPARVRSASEAPQAWACVALAAPRAALGTGPSTAGVRGQGTGWTGITSSTLAGNVGVQGIGGTAGSGGEFIGTAGFAGVHAQGGASGAAGAYCIGTGVLPGVHGVGGPGGGVGGLFERGDGGNGDVIKANGYIDLSGAGAPASSDAFVNRLTSLHLPKAFGKILTGAVPSLAGGMNVATVTVSSFAIIVTLASPMADTNYTVLCSMREAVGRVINWNIASPTVFHLTVADAAGTQIDLAGAVYQLSFSVFGAQ